MIYSIRRTGLYEQYFKEFGSIDKDVGGSVFETFEEAKQCADEYYSVYGVEADWIKDTIVEKGVLWRSLTRPAKIVKL